MIEETCLPRAIHLRIEEVFAPIFFHYPNGTKDRSVWQPRDTSIYIRQWRELASKREWLTPNAAATEHSAEFSKEQVTDIFKLYMEEMKKTLRPDQRGKKWTYYKSCTESKMRREAGHVFIANAIWTLGLPRLPPFATEQRPPSATDLEAVPEAIQSVLEWLDRIASALMNHHATKEYEEALRKSGVTHGETGLSATEQKTRAAIRNARFDTRIAKELATKLKHGTLRWDTCMPWQKELLDAYRNGSLDERLREVTSGGSRDTMCRTPSLAIG